ncbi:MAG: FtsX-like permease family protein [Saprospiraceae bacterium]
MNWPMRIARRYLFAKKSANIINLITGIAVFGIAVGTAALVLVLSVFNGFEDLITSMYSSFNPQVKASPAKGKTFELKPGTLERLRQLEEVQAVSQTLEEVAFFEYRDKQDFGVIKGVDEWFNAVTGIGKTVKEGRYALKEGSRELAVLGLGMYNKLTVSTENYFEPLHVYLPKKRETSLFEPQFTKRSAYPTGVFFIQQDFDNRYVLTSLELCQSLLGNPRALSALEFRLKPGVSPQNAIPKIQAILGPDIVLRDRYQQEEAFMRLMKIEKWMSFAIVSLTLLMVAFNMVGALWMIVLEKQKDVAMLKSMGAPDRSVRDIFLYEGMWLCILGGVLGFALALLAYFLQKTFGIIGIPGAFAVQSYPISLRFADFIVVAATVLGIGLLASIPPALRAQRIPALVREA